MNVSQSYVTSTLQVFLTTRPFYASTGPTNLNIHISIIRFGYLLTLRSWFLCIFIGPSVTPVLLTLNIPSIARQRCLSSSGDPMVFFVISQLFDAVDYSNYVFWVSVIQALLASNILCLFISTEVTGGTELLHTHSSLIQHLNNVIFWALSAGHF